MLRQEAATFATVERKCLYYQHVMISKSNPPELHPLGTGVNFVPLRQLDRETAT